MIVVAFYTAGTSYEQEAALLGKSLDRVGMKHDIQPVPDMGDWYRNTLAKPSWIQGARAKYAGPLLYVDVDAFVHRDCTAYFEELAAEGYDFGAHWFAGPAKGHDQKSVRAEGWWMLSGTLFFGDTIGAKRLLRLWVEMNRTFSWHGVVEGGGQKNLWYLTTCMTDLKIKRLPGRYTYVFDKKWAYPPKEPNIIEHLIASRENRGPSAGRVNRARQERIEGLRALVEGG